MMKKPNPTKIYRLVMFHLCKQLKQDNCFRCGEKINRIEDFSVEHKKPWLTHPELYLDVDNIAFSHWSCNTAHGRSIKIVVGRPRQKKNDTAPAGTKWCGGCKDYRDLSVFRKDKDPWAWCSECKRKHDKRRDRRSVDREAR